MVSSIARLVLIPTPVNPELIYCIALFSIVCPHSLPLAMVPQESCRQTGNNLLNPLKHSQLFLRQGF